MKFNPPQLRRGPLSGKVYVITHGKVVKGGPGGNDMIEASVKYDVTEQFDALVAAASNETQGGES